jgi:dihydrodipicolinate synthase/N-acetylneuraminate lyase
MLAAPYYELLTIQEITRSIKDVASAVELPIMLYNAFTTGVNLEVETIAAFGRDVEHIKYVKDPSTDWEQTLRLIHHHRDDIGLIMGWDSYSFSALLEGGVGVIVLGLFLVFSFFNAIYTTLTGVYPPEVLPTEIRGIGTGFATSVSRVGGVSARS